MQLFILPRDGSENAEMNSSWQQNKQHFAESDDNDREEG